MVTTALGEWVDAGVILGVVLINALLGFIQEGRAEKALDSIRNMLSAEARIQRGGETRMIPAEDLVPGDIGNQTVCPPSGGDRCKVMGLE